MSESGGSLTIARNTAFKSCCWRLRNKCRYARPVKNLPIGRQGTNSLFFTSLKTGEKSNEKSRRMEVLRLLREIRACCCKKVAKGLVRSVNAWRTAWPDALCAGRLFCVRLRVPPG
jgi:hypothetical protein